MPTKNHSLSSRNTELEGRDRVERGEPVGRGELDVIVRAVAEGPISRALPQEIVDQALAQERARRAAAEAVPQSVRERLPDELIDELLAGRSGEAEGPRSRGAAWRVDQAADRARDGRRADLAPGL
jgi:hypothetical protein